MVTALCDIPQAMGLVTELSFQWVREWLCDSDVLTLYEQICRLWKADALGPWCYFINSTVGPFLAFMNSSFSFCPSAIKIIICQAIQRRNKCHIILPLKIESIHQDRLG